MAEEIANPPTGDAQSEALRKQLEQTRSALARKLESFQTRLTKSVETACDAVDETMHSAKQTAQDAVQSIRSAFDLKQQAARHPWAMMGVATFAGMFLAQRRRACKCSAALMPNNGNHSGAAPPPSENADPIAVEPISQPEQPMTKRWLSIRLQNELDKLQGAAIGAGVNIFRDWIKRMMPPPASRPDEEFKNGTSWT